MGIHAGGWPWLRPGERGGRRGWLVLEHLFPGMLVLPIQFLLLRLSRICKGLCPPLCSSRAPWSSERLTGFVCFEPGPFLESPCSSESLCQPPCPARALGFLITFFLGTVGKEERCSVRVWFPRGHLGGRLGDVSCVPHLGLHTWMCMQVFCAASFSEEWIRRFC